MSRKTFGENEHKVYSIIVRSFLGSATFCEEGDLRKLIS